MEVKKLTIQNNAYPLPLRDIPSPPKELFYLGADPSEWLGRPRVAVVGSRSVTPYGKLVTTRLSGELAQHGVVIIKIGRAHV